jgi:hypothetical protein
VKEANHRSQRTPRFRWVLFVLALSFGLRVFAGPSTNEFTLFKQQSRHQAYEWRLSEARLLATPGWDAEHQKIRLGPDKAWQIARVWLKKHGYDSPELVSITLRRLAIESNVGRLDKRWLTRFFYRIECVPAVFDSMLVVVLLDGTVVEPSPIPDLPVQETI